MATTPTPPIPVAGGPTNARATRGGREVVYALAIAFVVAALVFLSTVGVITLIDGNRTLDATHANTVATEHTVKGLKTLNENAAQFFHEIGPLVANLEQNQYVTCLAVHAIGCAKPG